MKIGLWIYSHHYRWLLQKFNILLFSLVFDVLDGFAARKLRTQSLIGQGIDSLADLIVLGVAPAYCTTF